MASGLVTVPSSMMKSPKRINEMRNIPGGSVWQRNDHEHIIRDEESFDNIREYIMNNPQKFELDRENPIRAIHVGAIHESPLQKGHGTSDRIGRGPDFLRLHHR
ncbi:MAG: hypothetical protein AB1547_15550 [Thermodesulfobacteriota bacterium]